LGSGILCSAVKSEKLPESALDEAIHVMGALNKPGCEAAQKVGVRGGTDITGFGLIGHAAELAEASDVTITLHASAVPLLEHALDLAEEGIVTRAAGTARKFLGAKLLIDDMDETLANVLADAQTSGGLLLSVAAEKCDALVGELNAAGAICAAVVGEVAPAGEARIRLVP